VSGVNSCSATAPITAAIVSWNTSDLLERCLRSLAGDVEAGRVDAWVVDNASDDGSPTMVREQFPWVHLVAATENLGFGPAVNLIGARTSTPWLAVANADTAVRPGAVEAMLAAGEADAMAGALAPRLILPDASTQHSVFAFPTAGHALAANLNVDRLSGTLGNRLFLLGAWDPDIPRRVPWAIAAFLLVRRAAWDATGGFDDEQWMYAEDLDLGWRLRQAGWATRYVPDAAVEHESAASAEQAWGDDRVMRWQQSTYAWMIRRRGLVRTRMVAVINYGNAALRWFIVLLPARVAGPRWRLRRDRWRWWMRVHRSGLARAETLRAHR
jgi:N-acetylglucosaminyl-diphospho-decaprenol L-rhamnosyltransferase